ncbi:sulfotransferase family protein [Sphingomonas immobilis]|uniref:Aspartyl beta-hydroxylase n=1 Tax=Sphingomonas immobilis TaxID=3063997 RepID=A0ABT8ZZZ0_9SPHN|nr:hypothetical protein [Sphingomonas sp. CA1-15]MDO7843149.1 hypothetical protein [Sphingomonas sp. CA1-15]
MDGETPAPERIERLQHLLRADTARHAALAAIEDAGIFAEAIVRAAEDAGIALHAAEIAGALRPDPLGLDRFAPQRATTREWPDAAWRPVDLVPGDAGPLVVWAHFAGAPLAEPFFEDSRRRAVRRPFNRWLAQRTPLADLAATMPPGLREPDGFVFHLSRCGSTLVAQMIAALPDAVVVSEAPILDEIVQLTHTHPDLPEAFRIDLLRAMAAALGRGGAGPIVFKLDSWHAMALPLFRKAFPAAPWVFLYRDLAEIIVSQMRIRGSQMVQGMTPYDLYGIDTGVLLPPEEYCARVLGRICEAVSAYGDDAGLTIDYADLPGAVEQAILPHLGITTDAAGLAAMRAAAARDAKQPQQSFTDDRAAKQAEVSDAIRAAVRGLGDIGVVFERARA